MYTSQLWHEFRYFYRSEYKVPTGIEIYILLTLYLAVERLKPTIEKASINITTSVRILIFLSQ